MSKTGIQWTDHSINPIRASKLNIAGSGYEIESESRGHYCEKISPGCANCYASTLQRRFNMPAFGSAKNRGNVNVGLDEKKLAEVLRRRKPTKYFWCDMTDMFGEWVPDEWIDKCFATMALTPQHTHQVLTKRPGRMAGYFADLNTRSWMVRASGHILGDGVRDDVNYALPLPNVWLGTSVEDMERTSRIDHLLKCPAAVRFISAEPLLERTDFAFRNWVDDKHRIDWVIVGGESGHGARPCDVSWIRLIVEDCKIAGVSCFVKQLGANAVTQFDDNHSTVTGQIHLNDKKGGDPEDWPEDLRVREFPTE